MADNLPAVTVIIPNYNQSGYVGDAIQSVLSQTFKDFEIIVVDDGSTDNSREVVAQFGPLVQYIWQENCGLAGARNTGLRAAKGELISLLDADDQWRSDYLQDMFALARDYPDVTVFYCAAQCMDVEGRDLPQFVGSPPEDQNDLYQILLRANFIIPSTVTFRRKPIVEAGSFDATLRSCEDWDLWLRILPAKKFVGISKNLVRYRVHNSSLSTNLDGMHGAMKKMIEKNFGTSDGDLRLWSPEKRRAYGGLYRYQCITFIQRQNNWEASLPRLQKALQTDPSLALDLGFFYELALGVQPVGYRNSSTLQGFEINAACLEKLVSGAVEHASSPVRRQALGTAYYALALVSYNWGTRSLSRKYFGKAVVHRPDLILNTNLVAGYLKSYLSKGVMENIKKKAGRSL